MSSMQEKIQLKPTIRENSEKNWEKIVNAIREREEIFNTPIRENDQPNMQSPSTSPPIFSGEDQNPIKKGKEIIYDQPNMQSPPTSRPIFSGEDQNPIKKGKEIIYDQPNMQSLPTSPPIFSGEDQNPIKKVEKNSNSREEKFSATHGTTIRHIYQKKQQLKFHYESLRNARNTVAIVSVLIATVTFTVGIHPPVGVQQHNGDSVDGHKTAFKIFVVCNNVALFLSLGIVVILVSVIPFQRKVLMRLLKAIHKVLWVAVSFMTTAYLAAVWVVLPQSSGSKWMKVVVMSTGAGITVCIFIGLGIMLVRHCLRKFEWKKKQQKSQKEKSNKQKTERSRSGTATPSHRINSKERRAKERNMVSQAISNEKEGPKRKTTSQAISNEKDYLEWDVESPNSDYASSEEAGIHPLF